MTATFAEAVRSKKIRARRTQQDQPVARPAAPVLVKPTTPATPHASGLTYAQRVERMVHEAMLTSLTMKARDQNHRSRSCWPDYLAECDDDGKALPTDNRLRPLVAPWTPTARHISEMEWVEIECFGQWFNRRSKINGLEPWQRMILELRAWQIVLGMRGGWRGIADAVSHRSHAVMTAAGRPMIKSPRISHTWAKMEHDMLVRIAVERAVATGWG